MRSAQAPSTGSLASEKHEILLTINIAHGPNAEDIVEARPRQPQMCTAQLYEDGPRRSSPTEYEQESPSNRPYLPALRLRQQDHAGNRPQDPDKGMSLGKPTRACEGKLKNKHRKERKQHRREHRMRGSSRRPGSGDRDTMNLGPSDSMSPFFRWGGRT